MTQDGRFPSNGRVKMMGILAGVLMLAAFVGLIAIIGWEPNAAEAPFLPASSTVSDEYVDRQRQAELAAREAV